MSTDSGQSASSLYHSDVEPIRLDYERNWADEFESPEFYSDYGFVVRATAETGEDVHLWTFMYRQACDDVVVQGDVCQTVLVVTDFTEEQKRDMHATAFVDLGQNIEDYHKIGTLTVDQAGDRIDWRMAGREFSAMPPVWYIRGEHAGVSCDIRIDDPGPGLFHLGRFEDWPADGTAGYQLHARAEGVIEVGGRILHIHGFAVHENLGMRGTTTTIPNRLEFMGGQGLNWAHSFGDEFSWYIMNGYAGPAAVGMVRIGGEVITAAGMGDVWLEKVEEWLDPDSKQLVPRAWRAYLRAPQGQLEATLTAYGRGYYTWNRRGGVIVVHQLVGQASSRFTFADGRVLHSDPQLAFVEHMRTFHQRSH
jgi:hypothetical protein